MRLPSVLLLVTFFFLTDATAQFTITTTGGTFFCEGEEFVLYTTNTADYDSDTYQWYAGDFTNPIAGATEDTLSIGNFAFSTGAGVGQFQVFRVIAYNTVSNQNDSANISITRYFNPPVDLGADTSVCPGENITLTDHNPANAGIWQYAWGSDNGYSYTAFSPVGLSVSIDEPGTYWVRKRGPYVGAGPSLIYDCRTWDTVEVVSRRLNVDIPEDRDTVCQFASYTIPVTVANTTATDLNFTYVWTGPDGTIPASNVAANGHATIIASTAGTHPYSVEVTGVQNCPGRDTIWLHVYDAPPINLGPDLVVDAAIEDEVDIDASQPSTVGFDFEWTWLDQGLVVSNDAIVTISTGDEGYYAGNYGVLVTDPATGCTNRDNIRVSFDFGLNAVYVPNVFAPNLATASLQEMEDDTRLKVFGTNIKEGNFSFRVFNQWGEEVYSANRFTVANEKGWDGGNYPAGTYTYTVSGEFTSGEKFEKAGAATLIR